MRERGRPRDAYPKSEFRLTVIRALTADGVSLRRLEALSGVNRGTLSGVLHGHRPCERHARKAIIRALGLRNEDLANCSTPAHHSRSEQGRIVAQEHSGFLPAAQFQSLATPKLFVCATYIVGYAGAAVL